MKRLNAITWMIVLGISFASAEDSSAPVRWDNSPLAGGGELEKARESLAQIFQFKVDGGRLKIDRAAWERTAKEFAMDDPDLNKDAFEKMQAELAKQDPKQAARMQMALRMNRMMRNSMRGPTPPLLTLFQKLQAQVGARSGGSGSSGLGDDAEWHSEFSNGRLSGRIYTSNKAEDLVLRELLSPNRSFELHTDGDATFRIQLTNRDLNVVLFRQESNGRFSVLALVDGQVFADQRDSFVAFFKHNRRLMKSDLLPALAKLGIRPILSPDSPEVRNAVFVTLLSASDVREEGERLVVDLDSETFETREKASKLLSRRYGLHKDLVQHKLDDKSISAEAFARLRRIVVEQFDLGLATQTAMALGLADDPGYIVSLLDNADSREFPIVVQHLEKITGQKLGTDPAAWKDWSKNNLPRE